MVRALWKEYCTCQLHSWGTFSEFRERPTSWWSCRLSRRTYHSESILSEIELAARIAWYPLLEFLPLSSRTLNYRFLPLAIMKSHGKTLGLARSLRFIQGWENCADAEHGTCQGFYALAFALCFRCFGFEKVPSLKVEDCPFELAFCSIYRHRRHHRIVLSNFSAATS